MTLVNSKQSKILAIIPARAGSKGIPQKNIALLAKKPLIAYVIVAAQEAKLINRLIVSTDSPQIAQVAQKYGAEAPFLRPAEISNDQSPVIEAFQHALKWLKENENYQPEAVLCLQATSPFRTAKQIDQAIKIFLADKTADTLVSVEEISHRFLPEKLMTLKGKYLQKDILCQKQAKPNLNRQGLPVLYARNGPNILIGRPELITQGVFYGQKILPFIMPALPYGIDIDNPEDLKLAELFIKNQWQ